MNVNFIYTFEKQGEIAPEDILENELWVDVGNTVKDGVFDHHQDGKFESAFACVMQRTDCYKEVNDYLKSKQRENAEVKIHVHEDPDIDCLFSIFAIKRMVYRGLSNPSEAFDEKVLDILLNYVNTIDSGCGKDLSDATLYSYFCNIGADIKDLKKRSQEYIDEGLKLLGLVIAKMEDSTESVDLFTTPLEEYIDISTLKYYSALQEAIKNNRDAYQNDKKESRVIIKSVNLWNTEKRTMEPVKAAIWVNLPSGEHEYIFARDVDKCVLTVYPFKIKADNSQEGVTRAIIALNPDLQESEEFSLLPLAEVLEQCEQIEEELLYEQTKRYRRDHSRSRREDGRFSEIPFYETDDPWFISEKGDIIDAPRAESIIPYSRILSIIENDSSMTKKAEFIRFAGDAGESGSLKIEEAEELGEISFGELYTKTREKIDAMQKDESLQHLFAFVRVDPSMLRYSNNWLKACCLNMVGKSDLRFSRDNILQIDYRTCLYTDQSITILVAIDRRNQSLSSLVDEKKLENSRICVDLKNVLEHQLKLRSIGKDLSDTIEKITQESKKIDSFNEELVQLSTQMEEDDLIANPLEQEVYAFIKDTWGIESLKSSVTSSAQLLIKNAEQLRDRKAAEERHAQEVRKEIEDEKEAKRDSRIQAGIGLVTVFTVFSAWTDAFDFIAKFVPGNDGGWSDVFSCLPVMIIEIIVTVFILCLGCVAGKYVWQAWKGTAYKEENDESENS